MAKKDKVQVEFDEALHGNRLKELIKEASDNKLKAESYLDLAKNSRDAAKEELGVDGKMFNNILRIFHKKTRESFEAEKDQVVELYDTIFDN